MVRRKAMKKSLSEKTAYVLIIFVLVIFTVATVYPIIHVVMASFSDGDLMMAHQGLLLRPLEFNVDAYKRVFENEMIMRGYLNTIIVVAATLILNFLLTSFAAYFLSRKYLYTANAVMFFIMVTMYFSGGTVPFYFAVKNLGLYNSLWSIILPASANAFNIIVLRTAFSSMPDSIEEAALVDGANHFTILFKIFIPLSKASLAVVMLYYLVAHWNSWFNAMIFLKDRELYPLQLVLRDILVENDTSNMTGGASMDTMQAVGETVKYAVIVVSTLPVMMIYPFLQKYFAKGAMVGAVKG
ncbi:MAG: carbohydrate ABC transporter permease [Clostridia bacterium]|nr:carbohydrate ABC transporter permease [Clostridia bacterium]